MNALVWVEHDNAALKDATLAAVTAAAALGEVTLLVAGSGCRAVAEQAAQVAGVAKVLHADGPHFASPTAENVAAAVVAVVKSGGYSHVLASATGFGKNTMPRVAALCDVAQISDISGIESADTFVRPIYAGNALATVQSSDPIKVVTVRITAGDEGVSGGRGFFGGL